MTGWKGLLSHDVMFDTTLDIYAVCTKKSNIHNEETDMNLTVPKAVCTIINQLLVSFTLHSLKVPDN